MTALHRSAGLVVTVRDEDGRTVAGDPPPEDGLVVPVELPGGHGGELVAAPGALPEEEAVRLLRIGATTVAVLLASERSVAEAELRTRGEFVHALLSSDADEASLVRRARAIGIDLRTVTTVAVVDAEPVGAPAAGAFAARLATELGGWSATHAGQVVVLLPVPVEQARAAATRLSTGAVAPTTGLAAGAGGPAGVRAGHEEARQTAALLVALDRAGTCAAVGDLGLYRSLFHRSGRADLTAFVRATVGPLLDHDRDRQRDLAVTLETYLEQARHHARTCEVLHIHANTLYQRLDRITEVLGPGWKEPGRALDLQVALRLHRLMADRPD